MTNSVQTPVAIDLELIKSASLIVLHIYDHLMEKEKCISDTSNLKSDIHRFDS